MLDWVKDYQLISLIGKGAYGSIYKAKKASSGELFAIKLFDSLKATSDDLLTATNEINILSSLKCEYIVKLYDHFIEVKPKGEKYYCIVMELCERGDLSSLIQSKQKERSWFSEQEVKRIMTEICKGLNYLHLNKVIHRDLKSMNILINRNNVMKIGDFGVSKVLKSGFARTFVGTPYYLSPEICQDKVYNEKSDIWSLGCVLYEIMTLVKPFDSNNQLGLIAKIIKGVPAPISPEIKKRYSESLFELMHKMLEKNVKKRLNINEILDWFSLKEKGKKEDQIKEDIKEVNVKNDKPMGYVKKKSIKEIIPKRVRLPPKSKTIPYNDINKTTEPKLSAHQISRQALLAFENQKLQIKSQPPIYLAVKSKSPIRKIARAKTKEEAPPQRIVLNHNIKQKEQENFTASQFMQNLLKSEYEMICRNKETEKDFSENLNEDLIGQINDDANNDPIEIQDHFITDIPNEDKSNEASPEHIIENSKDNRYVELFQEDPITESIPILYDLTQESTLEHIKAINNKEQKLQHLTLQAYELIPKENFDDLMQTYEEFQNNLTNSLTNELDKRILSYCRYDDERYGLFLEVFYKIVYLKFLQQVDDEA